MSNENQTILPWTKSCFVCGEENSQGLRLKSREEDGRVVLNYKTRPSDVGYKHIVHGGIAMTLLDEVMTWAAILEARKICVAAHFSSRLKAPIQVEQNIRVSGWVSKSRPRLICTVGEIADEATGDLLMTAEGRYMPMSGEGAALCEKDFVDSPEKALFKERFGFSL